MCKLYSLNRIVLFLMTWLVVQQAAANPAPLRDTLPADTLCPDIAFFSPTSGPSGSHVDIVGHNFTGTTSVSFGGVPASFTVISDSLIYATVGSGASGFVRVSKPSCTDSLGGFSFIQDTIPPDTLCPDIASFSPSSGREGTLVFITGHHFIGTSSVSFGGIPVVDFQVINDSLIYATVSFGASGFVRVSKPFCTDSLGGFTFIRDSIPADTAKPGILSFFPKKGSTGSVISIYGQHFANVTIVTFGGVPAASFTIVSDSMIRAIVGTGASGPVALASPKGWDSLGTFKYVVKDSSYTISVAPNPAKTFTIVTHPVISQPSQLKLADITGNTVRVQTVGANTSQTRFNLIGVRPGVYKLGWSDGGRWYTQTILVE